MLGNLDLFPPLREASWSELGHQVGPKLAQVGGKFGQVGAKMRHVGAKLAHVGAKLGQLRPTWPSKLDFWSILKHFQGMFKFVSIFQPILDRFFMVLSSLGTLILVILYCVLQYFFTRSLSPISSYRCWNFVDFWTQLELQNASKIDFWGPSWPKLAQVGPKLAQVGLILSQLEATLRPSWAILRRSWAKIGLT